MIIYYKYSCYVIRLIVGIVLQVENLRKHVQESGLAKRLELVIASPMSRY